MQYKNFNDFLQTQHIEENPQVLDDDLPDDFERWLTELDVEEIMAFADKYGEYMYKDGGRDTLNEVNSLASNPN